MPTLHLESVILASFGLAIMMVLVLLVIGAHLNRALVLRWMHGWMLIATGLSFYFVQSVFHIMRYQAPLLVNAFALICLGLSLYVNGIRRVRGYPVNHYLPLLVFTSVLTINAIFLNSHAAQRSLLVSNLLIVAGVFAYGSKSLMGRENNFINQVFWLCSSLFAAITLMLIALMVEVFLIDETVLQGFQSWSGHAYLMLFIVLALTSVTVLLVLILQVRTQDSLQAIATLDGLTGVLNRRGLQDAALKMKAVSQRIKIPMAMVVVDLDFFKKVNDVYGHLVGDAVLKACTHTIRSTLRGGDVIGRYGGEEFCLLLPNTGEVDAEVLAERIRQTIEHTPVNIEAVESLRHIKTAIKCTVSIGSVSSETTGYDIDTLFAAADHNLYQAKQHGRNRVYSNRHQQPFETHPSRLKRRPDVINSQD